MCLVYLAISADKQPSMLSPAEEFLIWTMARPHPSYNPPPVWSRIFSWKESLPGLLSCQVGIRIVESCKLQPSWRDVATSCLELGLLFPAKQATCVVHYLPWHVREEEEKCPHPRPESPAWLSSLPWGISDHLTLSFTFKKAKNPLWKGKVKENRMHIGAENCFSEACPLKPYEHVVCHKSTPAIVLVDYF